MSVRSIPLPKRYQNPKDTQDLLAMVGHFERSPLRIVLLGNGIFGRRVYPESTCKKSLTNPYGRDAGSASFCLSAAILGSFCPIATKLEPRFLSRQPRKPMMNALSGWWSKAANFDESPPPPLHLRSFFWNTQPRNPVAQFDEANVKHGRDVWKRPIQFGQQRVAGREPFRR